MEAIKFAAILCICNAFVAHSRLCYKGSFDEEEQVSCGNDKWCYEKIDADSADGRMERGCGFCRGDAYPGGMAVLSIQNGMKCGFGSDESARDAYYICCCASDLCNSGYTLQEIGITSASTALPVSMTLVGVVLLMVLMV